MMSSAVWRFLRSPRVIIGEIIVVALLCILGASLPQLGSATDAELARLRNAGPIVAALFDVFCLDRVFRSGWFCAAALLAAASLSIVIAEQLRRLRVAWKTRPERQQFGSAPFQFEFERPAKTHLIAPRVEIWTENRAGSAGSALLHMGLLLVMCAGVLRAMFGAQAVADLIEGETLPANSSGWSAQWPGLLARPVLLAHPITLERVEPAFYETGELRDLKVHLSISEQGPKRKALVAVNRDLKLPGGRLYIGSDVGPAALLEWQHTTNRMPTREAVLMMDKGKRSYEGTSSDVNGWRIHFRTEVHPTSTQPSVAEVRVMKGNALALATVARVGEILPLPNGQAVCLRGMPFWVRLRAGRDASLCLAYSGLALILLGALLVFAVTRLDGCLVVTPMGEREHVFVALTPQRFAPLFQDRFQELIRQHGGPETAVGLMQSQKLAGATGRKWFCCGGNCGRCVRCGRLGSPAARVPSPATLGLTLLLGISGLSGCSRLPSEQARLLVERYNAAVSEAYRRGDVKLIDPVVGPNEGKKILGLIGVRLDLGLTMDSELLALEIISAQKQPDEWRVRTRERWRYRDLKIGSGEQVGEESLDTYEMLYVFKKFDKAWRVDEIQFTAAPRVGRKTMTWPSRRTPAHAVTEQNRKGPES